MRCKKCGTEVNEHYLYCPRCGNVMKVKKKNKALPFIIIAGVVLVLAIILGLMFALGVFGNKSRGKNLSEYTEAAEKVETAESQDGEDIDESEEAEEKENGLTLNLGLPKEVYMLSTVAVENYEQNYEQLITVNWDDQGDIQSLMFEGDAEALFNFGYEENMLVSFYQENEDGSRFDFVSDADGNIIEEVYFTDGEKQYNRTYDYDENGNLLTFKQWDEDGNLHRDQEYRYNEENICIYEDNIQYNTDTGDIRYRSIREFDSEGGLIAAGSSLDESGNIIVNFYQERIYSDDRKVLDITRYEEDGEVGMSWRYTYDDNGNTVNYSGYYPDGSLYFMQEYTYDNDGNMLSDHLVDNWQKIEYTTEYTYDEHGNMLSETKIEGDGEMLWSKVYTYQSMKLKPYQIRRYEQLKEILDTAI